MIVFPHRPVTGFKQLYGLKATHVLCGMWISRLLDKGFGDALTEKHVLEEMKVNEISDKKFLAFKERLKVEFRSYN